ncbi:MAG TPA: site-specific integrase [Solirubrobacteraceae bacterium]
MARPQGRVVERESRDGTTYAIRFMAAGRRRFQTLGTSAQGWTRARAQTELANALADVRRGIWQPPAAAQVEVVRSEDPTFHEFASEWFEAHQGEWRPGTRADYRQHLTHHLLPFFEHHRLSQITISEVDRYRAAKVAEACKIKDAAERGKPIMYEYVDARGRKYRRQRQALTATTINKTITRLAQILELAVEYYDHIPANTAKGERRRVKTSRKPAVWLDSAEQISALLDAAGELDRELKTRTPRRVILSTLVFAGLRIGELCDLRWRDVDLAGGTISVRASKTDAGIRKVELLPVLQDELASYKARVLVESNGRVFATSSGRAMNPSNIRTRIVDPAVERASDRLVDAGGVPLPDGLSPHKLRHTFCSLLVALGTDAGVVMDQLGHTDPGFTLRVYRHGMRRDQGSKDELRNLVGLEQSGTDTVSGTISGTNSQIERVSSATASNGR